MAELPRLNSIIRALERASTRSPASAPADVESRDRDERPSKYDGVVFEMEHNPWDIRRAARCLQYMLNRAPDRQGRLGRAGR